MTDCLDSTKQFLIRLLRKQAHDYSVAAAPRVSREAVSLKKCADELEGIDRSSQFDRLMR